MIVKSEVDKKITVGALGELDFESGTYIYVGSAQNGLEARVRRHLSDEKSKHWHIDYLLDKAEIEEILAYKKDGEEECNSAKILGEKFQEIDDFGCSDCGCDTHLFYSKCKTDEVADSIRKKIGKERFTKEGLKEL